MPDQCNTDQRNPEAPNIGSDVIIWLCRIRRIDSFRLRTEERKWRHCVSSTQIIEKRFSDLDLFRPRNAYTVFLAYIAFVGLEKFDFEISKLWNIDFWKWKKFWNIDFENEKNCEISISEMIKLWNMDFGIDHLPPYTRHSRHCASWLWNPPNGRWFQNHTTWRGPVHPVGYLTASRL